MKEIQEALHWFILLLTTKSAKSYRKKMREEVMKGLHGFSLKGEKFYGKDNEAGIALVKELNENFEYMGFTPNVQYIKENEEGWWVHPWGTPTLLFKHKKLPIVVMTNPGIRLDSNFLKEMEYNEYIRELRGEMKGFTG